MNIGELFVLSCAECDRQRATTMSERICSGMLATSFSLEFSQVFYAAGRRFDRIILEPSIADRRCVALLWTR